MQPLTWNTDIEQIGSTRTYNVRGKWKNYFDSNDVWQPLSCQFNGYEQANGCFSFQAPLLATNPALFVSDCRWQNGLQRKITASALEVQIQALDVSPVEGIIYENEVVYPGAYGIYGDLIYRVTHGRVPRLEKIVKWNQEPSGSGDVRVSFQLNMPTVEVTTLDGALLEDQNTVEQKLLAYRDAVARNESVVEISEKEAEYNWWLLQYEWQGQKSTSFSIMAGQDGDNRGMSVRPCYVWDSNGNKQQIQTELSGTNTSLVLTKVIPRAFLESAVYPVYTDAVATFYPDVYSGSTSSDGHTGNNLTNISWASLYAVPCSHYGSTATDGATALVVVKCGTTTNLYNMLYRSFFGFDTSSINDTYTITDTTFNVKTSAAVWASGTYNIYGYAPASFSANVANDFNLFEATPFTTSRAQPALATNNVYNYFTLNSDGRAYVKKTGVTMLGLRSANYDVANSPLDWSSGRQSYFMTLTSEQSGTTSDPYLVVTSVAVPVFVVPNKQIISY